MPGAHPDQIDINFENGVLTINGRVEKRLPEGASVLHCEYGVGDFFRSFQLGETIDPERITAEYKDGVLTVHLPKTEAAKPRKISVRTQ